MCLLGVFRNNVCYTAVDNQKVSDSLRGFVLFLPNTPWSDLQSSSQVTTYPINN